MGVTSSAFRSAAAAGCLCAILFPRSALAQSSLPLKVLSYNLHHGEGTDGKLDLARIGRDPARSTVTFINTHLMVGSGAEADRLESALRINAFATDPARGDTGRPMILMGDMNATRGSGAIREFQKAWQASDFDYGIDWVSFRPAGRWRFLRAAKLDQGDAAVASDHLPVAQEMELLLPPAS